MNDFPVVNRDDRNEPVVVGRTARENLPVHFGFKDHDATILCTMHNKRVASEKSDALAVPREASHQMGSPSNRRRLTGKVISELEKCVFANRVEKMVAI